MTAEEFKAIREAAGLTQVALADVLGVTRRTIIRIELDEREHGLKKTIVAKMRELDKRP